MTLYTPEQEERLASLAGVTINLAQSRLVAINVEDYIATGAEAGESDNWLRQAFRNPSLRRFPLNGLAIAETALIAGEKGWQIEAADADDRHSDFAKEAIEEYLRYSRESLGIQLELDKKSQRPYFAGKKTTMINDFYPVFLMQRPDSSKNYALIVLAGRNTFSSRMVDLWEDIIIARKDVQSIRFGYDDMYNTDLNPNDSRNLIRLVLS